MQANERIVWAPEDREYAKFIFANYKQGNGYADWRRAEQEESERLVICYAKYSKRKFQQMGAYLNRDKEKARAKSKADYARRRKMLLQRERREAKKSVDPYTGATVTIIKPKDLTPAPQPEPAAIHLKHCPECGLNLVPIQRALGTLARLNNG